MYLFLYSAFYFYTKLDITKVLTCSLAMLHLTQKLFYLPDDDGSQQAKWKQYPT